MVSRQALIDSHFATVVCAPIFSVGEGLSTQVPIGPEEGVKGRSWIMCDNLVSMPKASLTDYVGSLSAPKVRALRAALRAALSVD